MFSPCLLDGEVVVADRRVSFALSFEPYQFAAAIGVIVCVVRSHIVASSDSAATAVETSPGSRGGCWPLRR